MNLLPSFTCPFPSLQSNRQTLAKEVKNDFSATRTKLANESLLVNRIALTVIGTFSAYLLAPPTIYPCMALAAGSLVSLPCTLLGTGTYFLLEGAFSILRTEEMTDLFQHLCWGGFEMGTAALMLYFYSVAPVGIVEPTLQQIASNHASTECKTLLNS